MLEGALRPSPILNHVIVIPIREIEAWLLADEKAIEKAIRLEIPIARVKSPESIQDPKRKLEEIIWRNSRKSKHYLNTADNRKIALECDPENLKRCDSFVPFHAFVAKNFSA